MTDLENYITSFFGVPAQDLAAVVSKFKLTYLDKNDFFVKKDQYCQKLSFIKSGYLRVYSSTDKKEITQWISSTGYFVTDISSLIFNLPSRWNIQALSDCELYTIHKDEYQRLNQSVPKWDILEKLFISKCFMTLEDRIFSHLSMTAEERYQLFFSMNPDLFNQVPLQYMASMMGMTPETLSRIRKKSIS